MNKSVHKKTRNFCTSDNREAPAQDISSAQAKNFHAE